MLEVGRLLKISPAMLLRFGGMLNGIGGSCGSPRSPTADE